MKNARFLALAGLALVGVAAIGQGTAPAQGPVVLAQDLGNLRAPGLAVVLWTRRSDSCTLQVVLETTSGARMVRASESTPQAPLEIEAWLVRKDGTRIPFVRRWQSANFNKTGQQFVLRASGPEVNFSFPLTAGEEAESAIVSVNGKEFAERLKPFPQH